MSYQTQQKQAILDFVKKSKKHPTAQDVYEGVKSSLPNISFATVYRNLDGLAKDGYIKEVQFVDHKKRYEGQTHQHQHFICKSCDRIIDMELSKMLNISETVEKLQCHTVEDFHLELIGTCAACK